METVKIKSCVVKNQGTSQKTGKPYTIYTVVLEDGRTGQSFESLEGEVGIEIESKDFNGTPQLSFKKAGVKSGGRGSFKPNTKITALQCAVDSIKLILDTKASSDQIIALAKKYDEYLNE